MAVSVIWLLRLWGGVCLSTFLSKFGLMGFGVFLARLLGPHQYGTAAVAMVALLAVLSINELGVSLAIVRWPDDPAEIVPTVATISVGASCLFYIGAFLAAPSFAAAMRITGQYSYHPCNNSDHHCQRVGLRAGRDTAAPFPARPADDCRSGPRLAGSNRICSHGDSRVRADRALAIGQVSRGHGWRYPSDCLLAGTLSLRIQQCTGPEAHAFRTATHWVQSRGIPRVERRQFHCRSRTWRDSARLLRTGLESCEPPGQYVLSASSQCGTSIVCAASR